MKYLLICLTCLILVYSAFSQNEKSDLIQWNNKYNLSWSDFKGNSKDTIYAKNTHLQACAVSCIELSYKYLVSGNKIDFIIINQFNKLKSFTCDTLSEELLQHEQCHFDLSEIYARKIRREVRDLQKKGINKIDNYINVFKVLKAELDSIDNQFDIDTFYGNVEDQQNLWQKKIKKELIELNTYSFSTKEDL